MSITLGRAGDTLVEVLLATVILSLVMAGAFNISNRATQVGQNSVERSQVSNYLQEQIEIIRAMRDVGSDSWNEITTLTSTSGSPNYDSCNDPSISFTNNPNAFYVNLDENTYPQPDDPDQPRLDFNVREAIARFDGTATNSDGNVIDSHDDFFAIWIEAYTQPSTPNYIEFHARACWDQLGGDAAGEASAIYGLQNYQR